MPRCARCSRRPGCGAACVRSSKPVRYEDHKGRPEARALLADGRRRWTWGFTPNDEVDELRWLELPAAAALLTHEHDKELVASLVSGHPGA